MFKNKNFYKTMFGIAIPIALQNLILSSVNLVDVFMVGKLGETSISALGLANQILFLLILFLFGINSGGSIFMAQFWGKKDLKNMHKVLGLVLSISILVSGLFFILTQTIPELLIRAYTPDHDVITLGAGYLRIVGWSYLLTAISFVFSIQLRNIGKTTVSVVSSVISLILNISLNYVLIFGHFGFPALGVAGAAIATSVARSVECIFIVCCVYLKKYSLASSFKEMAAFNSKFVKSFLQTASPVIFNEIIWAIGMTTYSALYGRMGTSSLAAFNIAGSIDRILFVAIMGLSSACGVMVGNKIGENDNEEAFNYSVRFSFVTVAVSIIISFSVVIIIEPILGFYNISLEVAKSTKYIIIIIACILPFKGFNCANIVGSLRAGGDTRFCLMMDIMGVWLIGVPFAFFGAMYLHLPVYFVFLLASSEEIFKITFVLKRLLSKKWIKNLVNET